MIIVFKQNATVEEKTKLKNQLESKGFQIHASDGVNASLFGVVGDTSALDINLLRVVEGVEKVMRVQEPFKRANRMFHPEDSIVDVAGRMVERFVEDVDLIQVGARNMQNFDLLKELGKTNKPILLKRGLAATIEEWLMAAEYIMSEGNENVILCERGIRTFETYTRNTLDVSAIPAVKRLSHLPVVVDPSHAAGMWWMVEPLAKAAVAVGADGLLIEVHNDPEAAWCDGAQSLKPDRFAKLMGDLRGIANIVGREL